MRVHRQGNKLFFQTPDGFTSMNFEDNATAQDKLLEFGMMGINIVDDGAPTNTWIEALAPCRDIREWGEKGIDLQHEYVVFDHSEWTYWTMSDKASLMKWAKKVVRDCVMENFQVFNQSGERFSFDVKTCIRVTLKQR